MSTLKVNDLIGKDCDNIIASHSTSIDDKITYKRLIMRTAICQSKRIKVNFLLKIKITSIAKDSYELKVFDNIKDAVDEFNKI
jgi:hypothetical protein